MLKLYTFSNTMAEQKATTNIFIDKYHPKADGTCAVKICVTHNRKRKYYPTEYYLTPADFQKVLGLKPRKPFKDIAIALQAKENKAVEAISKLNVFTFTAFEKRYLSGKNNNDNIQQTFSHTAKELRDNHRIGTASSYECTARSLEKFNPQAGFSDVTPEFLRKYEKWMLDNGNSITTVGIYLRTLRALFNSEISNGYIHADIYPFGKKKYEIPTGNNVKKALKLSEISLIFQYKAKPGSNTELAVNYWKFSYLCNGINIKDMCLLKYENIKGDMIEFIRAKTENTKRKVDAIRVPILKDVSEIISRHGNKDKTPSNYIFPVLAKGITPVRQRQLIQQLTSLINDHMKYIAFELGIVAPVTTYAARHSFATVLQRKGYTTERISEALGHSSLETTKSYLAGFEDESKIEQGQALTDF